MNFTVSHQESFPSVGGARSVILIGTISVSEALADEVGSVIDCAQFS